MKKITKIIAIIIMMIMMTGCVKFNANMDIKKDKSMDYSIIYAVDTTYFGDKALFDEEDKKELAKKGFKLEEYADGNMKGFKITKKIINIDLVSTNENAKYSLSGLLSSTNESDVIKNAYLFKVEKGFLKNKYKATFDFSTSDSTLNNSDEEDNYQTNNDLSPDLQYDFDTEITDDSTSETTEGDLSNFDMSSMTSMDLSFNVTLPYPAISNNATSATENNKNLKWSLSSDEVSKIEFEFELYNMTNIYITFAAAIVVVVIVIIIICTIKNNKIKQNPVNSQQGVTLENIQTQQSMPNQSAISPIVKQAPVSQQPTSLPSVQQEVVTQQPTITPIVTQAQAAPQPTATLEGTKTQHIDQKVQ